MLRQLLLVLVAGCLSATGTGCEVDRCAELTSAVSHCFGREAAESFYCSPDLLIRDIDAGDCIALLEQLDVGKSDTARWLTEAQRGYIRDAVKKAIEGTLREVIRAVLRTMRGRVVDEDPLVLFNRTHDYHLVLATASDYTDIDRKLALVGPMLRDHGYDPIVVEQADEAHPYKLMLSRCPQPSLSDVLDVVEMVIGDYELLRGLGVQIELSTEPCDARPEIIEPVSEYVSRVPGVDGAEGCSGCELFGSSCVGRIGAGGYGFHCIEQRRSEARCQYLGGDDFRQCGYYDNGFHCDGWQFCVEDEPGSGQGSYGECRPIPPDAQMVFEAVLGAESMSCQGAVTKLRSCDVVGYTASVPLSLAPVAPNSCF